MKRSDTMNKTGIIVTCVVAVAIVAIAAAAILLTQEGTQEYRSSDSSGRLMIMGNANNDDYLDQRDVDMLVKLKGTSGWEKDHPLADANNDGVLTDADVNMVKRMVNREAMDIYYAYSTDAGLSISKVSYPVKNFLMVGDDVSIAMQAISAESKCKGVAVSDFNDPINAWVGSRERIGNKSTAADVALATNVADADTVLITSAASRYLTNQDAFELAGIKVIRMNLGTGTSGNIASNYGILTMGYLLGLEDNANEVVKFSDDVVKKVQDKIGKLSDSKKAKAIVANRTANISGKSSEYYYIAKIAGAKNMIDENTSHTSFDVGKGDDWLYGVDVDAILHFTSLGYGKADAQATFSNYDKNFRLTDAYKAGNYYLMNANMPTAVCVAFSAAAMYPGLFEERFGYDVLNEYIDRFTCLPSGYDAETSGAFFFMGS